MADADQPAETELLATMMLEGPVTVPDGDTSTATETVQREGDTVCPGQAEGSLDHDNLQLRKCILEQRGFARRAHHWQKA